MGGGRGGGVRGEVSDLTLSLISKAPGLRVPVRSSVRVDDERLHGGDGLQHHLPHHRALWSVAVTTVTPLYCSLQLYFSLVCQLLLMLFGLALILFVVSFICL